MREAHRLGAFRRDTWLRLLADAGFDPQAGAAPESLTAESLTAESLTAESLTAESLTTECPGGRMPRNLLIGRRPR